MKDIYDHCCADCNKTPKQVAFHVRASGRFFGYCKECRLKRGSAYRDAARAQPKPPPAPYRWQPDPLNSVFVNWLQVRA